MMVIKLPHHNHIVVVYLSMIVTLHAWLLNVVKSQVEWSIVLLQKLILLKFCIRWEESLEIS